MKITDVRAIPMSDPIPAGRQHRTDLGTKVKSDAVLILVDTDEGLTGMGASLGSPETVSAIVKYDLAPALVGEDPMYSEFLWEKMYNGSRWKPALERGHSQPMDGRRGVTMEAVAGVDIAIWDVKSQALGLPVYKALGAVRDSIRGYGSGGWGARRRGGRRRWADTPPRGSARSRCVWSAETASRWRTPCAESEPRGAASGTTWSL